MLSGLERASRDKRAPQTLAYPSIYLTESPAVLQPRLLEAAPSLPALCMPVLGGSGQEDKVPHSQQWV